MSGTYAHHFALESQLKLYNFGFNEPNLSLTNLVYLFINQTAERKRKPELPGYPKEEIPSCYFPLRQWVSKDDRLAKATSSLDLSNSFPVCPRESILGVSALNWVVTIFLSLSSLLDEYLTCSHCHVLLHFILFGIHICKPYDKTKAIEVWKKGSYRTSLLF